MKSKIPIYKAEADVKLEDGTSLVELIEAQASVAMTCRILENKDFEIDEKTLAKVLASSPSNPDQADLYYLNSVLVSTGWNKNTDVFIPEEVWAARDTPVDKMFNFMHNELDIIGHITGSIVVDVQGNVIEDNPPDDFDIVTSAVIYRAISDPEKRMEREKIIAEIEEGKWAVSMEALFNDFDYAVITPDGQHNIIERNETSAFLTKHLRAYGGTGEYDGFVLGRILKNIVYSGKGLVDNPAGPRSVILNRDVDPFKATSSLSVEAIKSQEKPMNEEMLKQQIEDLKAELAQAREESAKASKAVREQKDAEAKATIDGLADTISEKDTQIEALEAQVTELTEANTKAEEDLAKAREELDTVKEQVTLANRRNQLIDAGLSGDEVEAQLKKFEGATEEVFASIVELFKEKSETSANLDNLKKGKDKMKDEDKEEEEDAKKSKSDVAAEAAEEEIDEVETSEAALQEEESSEFAETAAASVSWFEGSLKTTANLK